jgi:hypothetical protein
VLSCVPAKERRRCVEHKNHCTNRDRHCNDRSEQGSSDERLVTEGFMHSDKKLGCILLTEMWTSQPQNRGIGRIMG